MENPQGAAAAAARTGRRRKSLRLAVLGGRQKDRKPAPVS
jgi:hypothetical protein